MQEELEETMAAVYPILTSGRAGRNSRTSAVLCPRMEEGRKSLLCHREFCGNLSYKRRSVPNLLTLSCGDKWLLTVLFRSHDNKQQQLLFCLHEKDGVLTISESLEVFLKNFKEEKILKMDVNFSKNLGVIWG